MPRQTSWRVVPCQIVAVFMLSGALAVSCGGPKTPCEQAAAHVSECTGSPFAVPEIATDKSCLAVAAIPCSDRRIMNLIEWDNGTTWCNEDGMSCTVVAKCEGTAEAPECEGLGPDDCGREEYRYRCAGHMSSERDSNDMFKFDSCKPRACNTFNNDKEHCNGQRGCKWWQAESYDSLKRDERCTSAVGESAACPVDTGGKSNSSGGKDSKGYCGDKSCRPEEKEDCTSCVADCGYCLACGDGSCNYEPAPGETIENCSNCPQDCGQCPVCGDGSCWENMGTDSESCASCPQDCCPSNSNGAS